VEFELAETPCQQVIINGSTVFTPSGAGARWAGAQRAGVDSYVGLPCIDTKGKVIGHLAGVDRRPMQGELPHDAVLRLFAVRASVEMERHLLERMRANTSGQSAGPPSLRIH